MRNDPRLLRPVGVLSLFAALPLIEAGLMAAGAFIAEGDLWRSLLSVAATAGAGLLLVAGVVLIARRQAGRRLALWGSTASIVACSAGALIGLVGGHGVLYGVGFPAVIVSLLRIPPAGNAGTSEAAGPEVSPARDSQDESLLVAV